MAIQVLTESKTVSCNFLFLDKLVIDNFFRIIIIVHPNLFLHKISNKKIYKEQVHAKSRQVSF